MEVTVISNGLLLHPEEPFRMAAIPLGY